MEAAAPNRDRCRLAAAEGRAAGGDATVQREDAAVAGQRASVEQLCALGFALAQVNFGLAQGFASLEEVVEFLVAEGATDGGVQSVLADAAVRPAGTSPLRPAAAPGTQQPVAREAGNRLVGGYPGTAPLRAERIPGVTPDQNLGVEVETAAPDPRRWRSNPACKRGGWRVKRVEARKELKRATIAGDEAAVAVARDLLRRDDHRAPAQRSDARAADADVAGSGRRGRQGQGGKGGRRSKARTSRKRAERLRDGVARRASRGASRRVTFSPTPTVQTIQRNRRWR